METSNSHGQGILEFLVVLLIFASLLLTLVELTKIGSRSLRQVQLSHVTQ